jgi:hypothetical protein
MFEMSKPTWHPLSVYCGGCGQDWDDWQPSGCVVAVWLAVMEALCCPHCGEDRRLFMRAPDMRAPERSEIPRDD